MQKKQLVHNRQALIKGTGYEKTESVRVVILTERCPFLDSRIDNRSSCSH